MGCGTVPPMSATYQTRIQRLRRLEAILPRATTLPGECLGISRLLDILGDAYGQGAAASRRRALQRDLDELVKEGRIESVNPGGKTRHYRRLAADPREDDLIWQYTLQQVRDLIAEALPLGRIDRLWQRLLHELDEPLLDERRLRLVPDTLRLRPVELYPEVLEAVILALGQRCVLAALYEDAAGVRGDVFLHPQALMQRGPLPYLFALKNDEAAPVLTVTKVRGRGDSRRLGGARGEPAAYQAGCSSGCLANGHSRRRSGDPDLAGADSLLAGVLGEDEPGSLAGYASAHP